MAEFTLQDMLEHAMRRVAETPAFEELARVCPHSELYFQIQAGEYVSGALRIKARPDKEG